MMKEFPKQLSVSARGQWSPGWPLLPWLAARTTKVRIGMRITDTPYRAPGVFAAECATIDHMHRTAEEPWGGEPVHAIGSRMRWRRTCSSVLSKVEARPRVGARPEGRSGTAVTC